MKAKKRFLSLLLVMCLMIGMLPVGVLAAENGKALQAGAGAIEKNDTVYYGTEQRAWQVLSANGNGGTYSDGANAVQADSALFLFLRSGLRQLWFDDENSNDYKTSTLRAYLNNENVETSWGSEMSGYVSGYFSEAEWANVLETTKTGADTSLGGVYYSGPGLDGDRLFALSANELMDYLGYSDNPASCTAGLGGKNVYWLRSAAAFDSSAAGAVYSDGLPSFHNVDLPDVWVRPAFNLNLNSVLFTSAAEGGKSSGAAGADALTPISEYTGSEWKLTLKDSSRSSFSIGTTAVNGNTLTVAYSGAKTGTNEYISAVIKDENGEITYYGRIKQAADSGAASGTVDVTLPADFDSSTDTLYLFSEQYNGDKMTDYAGALQKVSLAKNAYTVTYYLTNVAADTLPAFVTGDSDFTAALSASGDYALPESITVTVGGTALTADSSYTYNASTGSLTIYSSAITGDIVITAGAEAAQISAPDVDVQSGESDYASGVWTDSDVTFTISGSSAPSGIAKYQYSANTGASWSDLTISGGSASLTVSDSSATADGTSYIFRAVSNSGTEGTVSAPVTVKIDKTEPTITASGNTGNYLQNDAVTVSVNTGFSGVAKVEVSKDGGEAQDITQSYADGYAVTENGTYTFTVTNGAGVTDTDSITYDKLDQTKPVVSLDTHGYTSDEWTNGDVTLSVSDTSAALGDTKFVYKVGDGEWQAYTGAVTASEDTNGTVYSFRAVSASGVESETVSVTVKIDKTAPDGEIVLGTNHWNSFLNKITFDLFFKETQSVEVVVADDSVVKIEYLVHEGDGLSKDELEKQTFTEYTGKFNIVPDQKCVIYVRLTDHADNVTYLSSNGIVLDGTAATAPAVTANGYTSGDWTKEDVTLTVSGSSALSGIAKYQVSTDNGTSWTDMTMTNGTASLTVSDSSASADGTTYIFRAVSNSGVDGNTSAPITVKIDKTEPTITASGNKDDYLQSDTVTVSVNTGFSGVAKVEVSEDGGEAQDITQSYADGYAVTENGTYIFTVTSGAGVTATSSITYDKLDQIKPVVSLDTHGYTSGEWTNGDVTLSVSDTSAALGDTKFVYKAGDGEWQEYTDTITVSNETDGTVYSFRAISASGVESETVSVTVKIDKTAPTGEIVLGTNHWNSFLNKITFDLFFKETQSVEVVVADDSVVKIEYLVHEGDGLSKDKLEKQTFTAYTGKFSIEPDKKFVIYVRLTDHADNVTYLSSNGIVLDGTAATAPTVTTNGYTSGNWTDEDVTLTVSGSSALSGIAKYQVSTDNGTSWTDMTMTNGTASLTVSDSSASADGTTYIFRAVSNSGVDGNTSAPITVKIDKTEPTITASGNKDDYLQSDTVTVSASAEISGIAKVEVSKDGGEAQDITQSYADGYAVTENGTYTFTVTSGAGVTATSSITYDKLDQTKPVVSLDTHGYTSDEWTNGDVTLSVSDTSAALGDTKLEYKVGDGEWQAYTDAVTVSEDTNGTVYSFRAISASGVESETVSVTVKIDKTAPTGEIVLGTNHWNSFLNTITFGLFFKDTQSVEVAVADDSVVKIEYLVHEGDGLSKDKLEKQTFTEYTGKFNIDPDQKCVIYVRLTDHADNVTYLSSNGIVLDGTAATAPAVTANGYTSGDWTDEDVTITVSGSSALSGIDKYQVSTDNGTSWTDMTMTNGTASLTVSDSSASADGTTYIFRAVSNSGVNGNASAPVTVKIDKTAPTLTLSGNTDDYLQSDTVTVSASAEISGIAKVEVSKDGGEAEDITQSYADGYAVTENGTYTFTVTSGAGVTATSSITYDKLDQTKPVVSLDTHGYTSDEWTNGDVTLSVSDTSAALGDTKFVYKAGNGEWQAYTDAVTVSEDTNGTVYSFRAISASGVESETVSVTVKIDKTAPDGDITIEENSVKKFIHDVTFGLFFKENVEVAITGTDGGSGVQTVEYYRSAEVLTEEQVAALTDWTAYTSAISETAQDAEQFIYYVRITDQAGNTTCFASNGATFDLTKPVITGIADSADYYTTQSVQVTDTNLASVTLNGKEVGTEFTIAGNTETEYVIVAADKAGNETTVTVTMHKTEALRENLGDITKDNATSADRETVQDYLDDLKERLEDEELTDEEKTILEGLVDEAQDILDRLDETEQAGSTEAVDQTQDITSDNVTPEDKEALEQAKEDIEQALDQFGGNYTDEEKAELEEELSRIEEALDVIERIEDTEAAIEALPDTVNPDDTKAEEQINAAKDLYDALSDYEKSLISADAKDKLEGLLAALRDYRITEGSGSTFTKGSSAGLTFTANGAYSKFTGIEVDGETVNADCYTAENGSTVITLKAEYLETLAAGEHTLTVLYTDGEAAGTFTVAEKPAETVDDDGNTPQTGNDGDETGKDDVASSETGDDSKSPETGDDSNIALWIAVMLAAGAALTGTAVYSRKRKYSR